MIKLNLADLFVSSYSTAADDGTVDPGDDTTTGTQTDLKNTDPRACPYTQGWNCVTMAERCETGSGGNC